MDLFDLFKHGHSDEYQEIMGALLGEFPDFIKELKHQIDYGILMPVEKAIPFHYAARRLQKLLDDE